MWIEAVSFILMKSLSSTEYFKTFHTQYLIFRSAYLIFQSYAKVNISTALSKSNCTSLDSYTKSFAKNQLHASFRNKYTLFCGFNFYVVSRMLASGVLLISRTQKEVEMTFTISVLYKN
jgi:hypothetical protein